MGHAPGGGQAHAVGLRRRLAFIAERTRGGGSVRETEVQQCILDHFARNGLTTDHPPIVGVGPHSGDPHYEPKAGNDGVIQQGDFVLIDLWAKLDKPRAVYSDLTRVALRRQDSAGASTTKVFNIVAAARDAAIRRVRDAFAEGESHCRAGRWTGRPAT